MGKLFRAHSLGSQRITSLVGLLGLGVVLKNDAEVKRTDAVGSLSSLNAVVLRSKGGQGGNNVTWITTMNLDDFKKSLADENPPVGISLALQALWQEGKGDWDAAHGLAQRNSDAASAWVHAYLHRKESDRSNAAFWYARAGRSMSTLGFQDEWEAILGELLGAD